MSRFKLVATNILTAAVTAALTSAFWIAAYVNDNGERDDEFGAAGDRVVDGKPEVQVAEGLVVGPAGLAIPVSGIRADQLMDTYTQARAGSSRDHHAIDIMAPAGAPVVSAAPGSVEKLPI